MFPNISPNIEQIWSFPRVDQHQTVCQNFYLFRLNHLYGLMLSSYNTETIQKTNKLTNKKNSKTIQNDTKILTKGTQKQYQNFYQLGEEKSLPKQQQNMTKTKTSKIISDNSF